MNTENELRKFSTGESRLHFVTGVSGLIMKKLDDCSATVFYWANAEAAEDFISTSFPGNQRQSYSVRSLNAKEFSELSQSIKWLPENAEVNIEFYVSRGC